MGVTGLPFTAENFDFGNVGSAREMNLTGNHFQCESLTGTQIQVLRRYDNAQPPVGNITMSGFANYRTAA